LQACRLEGGNEAEEECHARHDLLALRAHIVLDAGFAASLRWC
jgi:hypothetical protein